MMKRSTLDVSKIHMESKWQDIAIAAGHPIAVQDITHNLLGENLLGAGIPHFPPSKIRQRVEALAAYDVGLLRKLSLTWPPPNEVPEYPNFAYGVWFAGLRHFLCDK